jgi:hypothetical protein
MCWEDTGNIFAVFLKKHILPYRVHSVCKKNFGIGVLGIEKHRTCLPNFGMMSSTGTVSIERS